MKVSNEIKNLDLTKLEQDVLVCLIDSLYGEPGFSDVEPGDIANETGISINVIRGVLSSLVKKGIVEIEYARYGKYHIIYLITKYWYLHPEWKEEAHLYL